MSFMESIAERLKRMQELAAVYPEMGEEPARVMQADSERLHGAGDGGFISRFSEEAMQLARHAAELAQASGDGMPIDVQRAADWEQYNNQRAARGPIPGVPLGVAEANPDEALGRRVYQSGSASPSLSMLTGSLLDNEQGLPSPIQHALHTPVLGAALTELARPANYVPPGILANAAGQLGARGLSSLSDNLLPENTPGGVRTGVDLAAGLVGGLAGGGAGELSGRALHPLSWMEAATRSESAQNPLGAISSLATGYRDLTKDIPIGAGIKDVSGSGNVLNDAERIRRLDALAEQVQREGGYTPDTAAQYQELTGRRPTSTMGNRPMESIAPPGEPGSRTPEDIIQGAGNAILKNQNAVSGDISNEVPLQAINDALQNAKAYANPVWKENVGNLRSQQAAILRDAAERGQSSKDAMSRLAGIGAQEPILYDPLQLTPEQEQATRDFIRQRAMQLQDQGTPGAGIFTRFGADNLIDQLKEGGHVVESDVQDYGKIFGPEAEATMRANLKRLGALDIPSGWQDFLNSVKTDPFAIPRAVNGTFRSAHTILDVATTARVAPNVLLRNPHSYEIALTRGAWSIVKPSLLDNEMSNLDDRLAAAGLDTSMDDLRQIGLGVVRTGQSLKEGGVSNDFISAIPGLGRAQRYATNMLSILRGHIAVSEIEDAIRGGMTPEQVQDPSFLEQIVKGTNVITGRTNLDWARNENASLLMQFANWQTSKFELLGRGIADGSISGSMARQSLAAQVGLGTMLAATLNFVAAKQAGQDPVSFAKDHVRDGIPQAVIPGTDITFNPYGQVIDVMRHFVNMGRKGYEGATSGGTTADRIFNALGGAGGSLGWWARGTASPLVTMGVDTATGSDFAGNPVRGGTATRNDTLGYFGRQASPFVASDIGQKSPLATALSNVGLAGVHEPIPPGSRPPSPEMQTAQDIQGERQSKQQALDDMLRPPDGSPPKITIQQWKDQRTNLLNQELGALALNWKNLKQKEPDPSQPWQAEGKVIADNTDAAGQVNWDAVDAWRATQSPETLKAIDDHTGVHDTPLEQQYHAVVQQLQKSGYYDLRQQAWDYLKYQHPEYKDYATFDDWKNSVIAYNTQQLVKQGYPRDLAVAEVDKLMGQNNQTVKTYDQLYRKYQYPFVEKNPDLAKQAIYWKLLSPDKAEMDWLGRQR